MEERRKLAEDVSKALTDGLEEAVLGAKSLREAFREVALEIAKATLRLAILGSLQKGLSSLIGGLLGVKPPVPAPSSSNLRFAAGGGPVEAGRAYMVGEVGRELFLPRVGGEIIPNYKLRPALAGGGGRSSASVISTSNRPMAPGCGWRWRRPFRQSKPAWAGW